MLAVAAGEQLRVEQQVQEGLVAAVRVRLDFPQERLEPQTQAAVEAAVELTIHLQVQVAAAAGGSGIVIIKYTIA
jgi:hypothetical protein